MDQVKLVEDSLQKIRSDMVCLNKPYHFKVLKAAFHKFCFAHSLCCPKCATIFQCVVVVLLIYKLQVTFLLRKLSPEI